MTMSGDEFLDQIVDAYESGELTDEEYEEALEAYEETLGAGEGPEELAEEYDIETQWEHNEGFASSIGKYFATAEEAEAYCSDPRTNGVLVWRYNEEEEAYEVGTIYGDSDEEAAA